MPSAPKGKDTNSPISAASNNLSWRLVEICIGISRRADWSEASSISCDSLGDDSADTIWRRLAHHVDVLLALPPVLRPGHQIHSHSLGTDSAYLSAYHTAPSYLRNARLRSTVRSCAIVSVSCRNDDRDLAGGDSITRMGESSNMRPIVPELGLFSCSRRVRHVACWALITVAAIAICESRSEVSIASKSWELKASPLRRTSCTSSWMSAGKLCVFCNGSFSSRPPSSSNRSEASRCVNTTA